MAKRTCVAGLVLAAAVLWTERPAQAYDGKQLLDLCNSAVFVQECLGYFEGVTDMLHLAPAFNTVICPPRAGLAIGDIIDIFKGFGERYPQHLTLTASEVIGMSLAQAHPCKDE
jgi:hypothetical protein